MKATAPANGNEIFFSVHKCYAPESLILNEVQNFEAHEF